MILIVALFVCMISAAIAASAADKQKSRNRAQKALRAGDLELAEKIFRELVARNERDTDARLGLSHALLKERRFQDSFDQAASVLAIDPSSARAQTLSLFALLIGTLQLSRALADRQLADHVLEVGIENALALLPRE